MASRRFQDPAAFGREARDASWKLLGRKAINVDWPASRSRRSVRVEFADGSVIATRRKRPERSQLEAFVMKTLHENGAAVPAFLAYDGDWLMQEYIEGQRLPHVFAGSDDGMSRTVLTTAAQELAEIHRIAARTGLDQKVVRLSVKEDWVARLIETPARIGEAIGVESPHLDTAAISRLVQAGAPSFVKWDARPGNAMMRPDGSVVWFDWEHCGARNALDDFAWLLADEYV
ncbi:MAG: phosphotransferase, partial [Alphaproteobacteria bacterium]|nr:phosphotransferase [Alphaproteobacteria bacterium]